MKKIITLLIVLSLAFSLFGCTLASTPPFIKDGYWYVSGQNTGVKAEGVDGKDGKDGKDGVDGKDMTENNISSEIGMHYMISDGLTDLAANAVEVVVDKNTGIAYAVYLASETSLGESTSLVKLAKFNILQPTNVKWIEVFNRSIDFGGNALSECNIIDLNETTLRVFAINKSNQTYYYKDVNKKTLTVGELKTVKCRFDETGEEFSLSKASINSYLLEIGGTQFSELQSTTKILKVGDYFYTTVVGGNNTQNILFMKSRDGAVWTLVSVIHHRANYEAMLEYHNGKFYVMCRNGNTTGSNNAEKNLMYSEDGLTWTQSNLSLVTSDTRPYLFTYQGEIYLAYSSPMPADYSTVRPWRCNVHIGKIVTKDGGETFEEVVYKESKFGIVYYALVDWYGSMIMLYSSGETHPTEGLMGGWSQGKDCLNYTVLKTEEPSLSFKTLSSITVSSMPKVTNYLVGDVFDVSGIVMKAVYTDGTTSIIDKYTISRPDMSTPGVKEISISYTENGLTKEASFQINVLSSERELTSIEIISLPSKLRYYIGEEPDLSGLVVKASYNAGSPVTLADYTVSEIDTSTVGEKTVSVSYTEGGVTVAVEFTVTVLEQDELEYIPLDSIKSTGTQYLDTGYITTKNTRVTVKLDKPAEDVLAGTKWLFNSAPKGGNRNFGLNLKASGAYVLDYGNVRYSQGAINWSEGINTITVGNGVFTINDKVLVDGLNVTSTPTTSQGTLIFFTSATSDVRPYLETTVFEISIYEGDTLTMHLIPAQRKTDGRIGFYDTVSEQFVFSATADNFQ